MLDDPSDPKTHLLVWEAYDRLRSARLVAQETGIKERTVRRVLNADLPRVQQMLDSFFEARVARWEAYYERGQSLMGELLDLFDGLLREIRAAAKEGRVTKIRGKDGYPLPVLDAIEYLVMGRLMDQMLALSTRAHQISAEYRRAATDADKPAAHDFDAMTDEQIAQVILEAGVELPPVLARKVRMIESKSRPVEPGEEKPAERNGHDPNLR